MKILIVNTSDSKGGAARAALRLHQGLQSLNANSELLVQSKSTDLTSVTGVKSESGLGKVNSGLRLTLDQLPLKYYGNYNGTTFSPQWLPDRLYKQIQKTEPDVVNLHWIHNGFLQIESLAKFKKPIVWTLHDMWAFTGGCHYTQECTRYLDSCGSCPQLGSESVRDLSHWIWGRKAKILSNVDLTVVTPSQWLGDCARSSSLLKEKRIECIPNGIDTAVYRPIDRSVARNILNLPQNKKLVLFGSLRATSDKRKGYQLLQSALQKLSNFGIENLELVIFGASEPANPPKYEFKTHYLGSFQDDLSLSFVYSAADVFVLPSIQENLANTVMEALACGTPCLAFNIGGMPDMIAHEENGYLAEPYEVDDLARGLSWIVEHKERNHMLSDSARKTVENSFSLQAQANRYLALFRSLRSHYSPCQAN